VKLRWDHSHTVRAPYERRQRRQVAPFGFATEDADGCFLLFPRISKCKVYYSSYLITCWLFARFSCQNLIGLLASGRSLTDIVYE
jgi:hypothetical protein